MLATGVRSVNGESGGEVEEDLAIKRRFADRYAHPVAPLHLEIERQVLGGDFGANGYTTREQADELGYALALAPGSRLLDLGGGRGWPGVYLAVTSGCDVVVVDRHPPALALAQARLAHERTTGWVTLADADALPFRPGSFDAIVHADVAC